MKSTAGWIGQVVSWLVIFAVLSLLAVCVVVPRIGGATPYTILTSSMRSTLPPGTLVVAKPTPIEQIDIGQVITYQLETGKPEVVTHRVIGRTVASDGTDRLITQGDDNPAPDADLVRAVQIRGTLWYSAPVIGRVNLLFDRAQHQAMTVAVGAALLLYSAYMLAASVVERRSPRRRTKVDA